MPKYRFTISRGYGWESEEIVQVDADSLEEAKRRVQSRDKENIEVIQEEDDPIANKLMWTDIDLLWHDGPELTEAGLPELFE